MRFRLTFLIGGVVALAVSVIASAPASAAPPIAGPPISRPMPPPQQQTQSRVQMEHRGSLIIADADSILERYKAIHDNYLITDSFRYDFVPDSIPAGGIESDTNGDGIVDDIYWAFSDGT